MTLDHAVLGCCLFEPRLVDECVAAGIGADSFTERGTATIWTILLDGRAAGKPWDGASIRLHPDVTGDVDLAVTDCLTETPTSLYFQRSLEELAEKTRRRRTRLAALRVCEACDAGDDIATAIEHVRQAAAGITKKTVSVADAAAHASDDFERICRGEPPTGIEIPWPWPTFNKFATPIREHELVVIGARPSQGKTSLALQLITNTMMLGRRVLHFALETSVLQSVKQMAAQLADINLLDLQRGLPDRQKRYREALMMIGDSHNLRVIDNAMALEEIESRCRLLAETWKPELVVIDYLQLVRAPGNSRYEQVTTISNRLMEMRKGLGCPLVVLSQLNRANQETNRAPQLSDMRDSGAIEQDAHRVVAIHRPTEDFSGVTQVGENAPDGRTIFDQYLMQLKNREGPLFNSKIKFHGPTTRFYEE